MSMSADKDRQDSSDADGVDLWRTRAGEVVRLRPIQPSDEEMMGVFHRALSPDTVYCRYFHMLTLAARIDHARLARICTVDPQTEAVLVAEHSPEGSAPQIVAVARLEHQPDQRGELALVVADAWHRHGLGREMFRRLIAIARQRGLVGVRVETMPENVAMKRLCEGAGMQVHTDWDQGVTIAELTF